MGEVRNNSIRIWLARLFIGLVFFFNVQCALAFLITPQDYVSAFELVGPPGNGMVRGMGILFLMWNVPYAFALWHPLRFQVSLLSALIMQAIGVIGESLLLLTFPAGHLVLRSSILRFIVFDAGGLVLLLIAGLLVIRLRKNKTYGT